MTKAIDEFLTLHDNYSPEMGTFKIKVSAVKAAEILLAAYRRHFPDLPSGVFVVEGKKGEYSVNVPRIRGAWWPMTNDAIAITRELNRLYQELTYEFGGQDEPEQEGSSPQNASA